jgi:excinuclease ABC subunit B
MANKFVLRSEFSAKGDQPMAIKKLVRNLKAGARDQVLLGATGSGKTFTMANVIAQAQKPTLVMCHNKTLAGQLAAEFKQFFPNNAVHYFVSYYDYYQPEAYKPQTDTYIEKETSINEEIDRLRHAATNALLSRRDVLIVASVSCIYGLGGRAEYGSLKVNLTCGQKIKRDKLLRHLTDIQYRRNDLVLARGFFQVKGDVIDVYPIASKEQIYKIEFHGDTIERLTIINSLTGQILSVVSELTIFPAKHFVTTAEQLKKSLSEIRIELNKQVKKLIAENKLLAVERLQQRTNYDLEMIEATGYCNGIENYSRHLTNRQPGQPPTTLLDYFPDDFLLFIDESHMTVPQVRGMYAGDQARKKTLIDFGFRLPSALDNRPLRFDEFNSFINQVVYVSATPGAYEYQQAGVRCYGSSSDKLFVDYDDLEKVIKEKNSLVAQQIIRPTGLLDPIIYVRPAIGQLANAIKEIKQRVNKKQRVLVTTLTKKLAEELSEYLQNQSLKIQYLHSEILTLDRLDILRDLRRGVYDVLIGINLLREGLDLPEVSLVIILDADKESFLRSDVSLIQTIGRAARHMDGTVIMYADKMTGSMERAIKETNRRRSIQQKHNQRYQIIPKTIVKDLIMEIRPKEKFKQSDFERLENVSGKAKQALIKDLEKRMKYSAQQWDFEEAIKLREQISLLKKKKRHD